MEARPMCRQCGVGATRQGRLYCSRACSAEAKRTPAGDKPRCKQCGIGVTRAGRPYCSRACSAEAKRTAVECTCGHCGGRFVAPPSAIVRGGGRYCTPDCYHAAKDRTWPQTRACAQCLAEFL